MVGFLIGTICLFGLIRVLRGGRGCGGRRGGGGCGGRRGGWGRGEQREGGWDERHEEGERHGGWRQGWRHGWLRWLYERLDTTPGQEKVLRAAIDELRESTEQARQDWREARKGVAAAVGAETFDEEAVRAAYARVDVAAQQLRDRFIDELRKVHEALDPEQRRQLADLIGRQRRGFGPYRSAS
jgi:Spy/CpxP family protein refolding chaperone